MRKDSNRFPTHSPGAEFHKEYGLTPAEARLADAFASEASLDGAASRVGLTRGTARQYLKRIFKKTSTSNQAQLMKLLFSAEARDGNNSR